MPRRSTRLAMKVKEPQGPNDSENVDEDTRMSSPEQKRKRTIRGKPELEEPCEESIIEEESGEKSRKHKASNSSSPARAKVHRSVDSNRPTPVREEDTSTIIETKTVTITKKEVTCYEHEVQQKTTNLHTQKDYNKKRTTVPDSSKSSVNILQIAMMNGVLLILIAYAMFSSIDAKAEEQRYSHFVDQLSAMKEAFSSQTKRFWKLLRNPTIVHLNNTSPPRPLVIMLAAPPGASTLMQCIARKLAYAIDANFKKEYEVQGKELKDKDGDEAKELLDVKLGGIFSEGNGVAIIHNLELLPAPSPLIFYSYCDDQNAAFKKSAVIFTVQLPQAVPEHLTTIKKESFVTDFLKDVVWSGHLDVYGEDRISALLSRITPTVAIIQEEEFKHIEKMCLTH